MPPKSHTGTLRAEVTLIDGGAQIKWVDPQTREVIWTETCTPKPGFSFGSQIQCTGNFTAEHGYFVDADNKRHLVLQAEPGTLGGIF